MPQKGERISERVAVTCPCGAKFTVTRARYDAGRGRYCSRECKYRSQIGRAPRNKGQRTGLIPAHAFKPGAHASPATEFKPGQTAGPAHPRWSGGPGFRLTERPGYQQIHRDLIRLRGPASSHACARADATCRGRMEWANISQEYLGTDDFMPLCVSHHRRHDRSLHMLYLERG